MSVKHDMATTLGVACKVLHDSVTVITCDHPGCTEGYVVALGTYSELTSALRREAVLCGWHVEDGNDRCPEHAWKDLVDD